MASQISFSIFLMLVRLLTTAATKTHVVAEVTRH
jgi:hypothetical protein